MLDRRLPQCNACTGLVVALVALFGCVWPRSAAATELVLTLDPAASRIDFTVDSTLHRVEGTMAFRAGELRFDPDAGTVSGRLVAAAASAATGIAARDRKLRGTVLGADRFPEIVFAPSAVRGAWAGAGESRLTLSGVLALRGADHPLTVVADVAAEGAGVTATSRFAVPFVDWGLPDPSVLFLRVAKVVQVAVRVVGTVAPAPSSAPALAPPTAALSQLRPGSSASRRPSSL